MKVKLIISTLAFLILQFSIPCNAQMLPSRDRSKDKTNHTNKQVSSGKSQTSKNSNKGKTKKSTRVKSGTSHTTSPSNIETTYPYLYGTTREFTDNAITLSYLSSCIRGWQKCRLGAITETGLGVAVYSNNGYATTGNLHSDFIAKLKELNNKGETFKSIAITNSGYYCIVYERNGWFGYVPTSMKEILNQYNKDAEDIYCVSISENGDYVIISDKHFFASNSSDMTEMRNASNKYGHVKYACITNSASIFVCEKGIYYYNIPTNLETKLKSIEFTPDKIVFTDSGTYLITNENDVYSSLM